MTFSRGQDLFYNPREFRIISFKLFTLGGLGGPDRGGEGRGAGVGGPARSAAGGPRGCSGGGDAVRPVVAAPCAVGARVCPRSVARRRPIGDHRGGAAETSSMPGRGRQAAPRLAERRFVLRAPAACPCVPPCNCVPHVIMTTPCPCDPPCHCDNERFISVQWCSRAVCRAPLPPRPPPPTHTLPPFSSAEMFGFRSGVSGMSMRAGFRQIQPRVVCNTYGRVLRACSSG